MKKSYLGFVPIVMLLLLVGTVSAGQSFVPGLIDPPIIVGGPSLVFSFTSGTVPPPPIPVIGGPFTYSSNVPTHVFVWDYQCVGDQYRVLDGTTILGDTSGVISEYPQCLGVYDQDTAFGDSRFSNGCFNVGPGEHSIDAYLIQSYTPGYSAGMGAIKVEEGYCEGTPAPEFPTMLLPITLIIGFLGSVLYIRSTRKQ
jgi:hypothetical protein